MNDRERARAYLADALEGAGITFKAASERVGRNDAYIQQYIRRGKPLWLPEPVRKALATMVSIDEQKLMAPPVKPRLRPAKPSDSRHKLQADVPRHGKLINDPGKLELLEIWDRIPFDRKGLALSILRNLTVDEPPIVA